MRQSLILVCMLFLFPGCNLFTGGQFIYSGILYDSDCGIPLPNAKVIYADADFTDLNNPSEIYLLDSTITDSNGRFELVGRPSYKVRGLAFIIYYQNSHLIYRLPNLNSSFQKLTLCLEN